MNARAEILDELRSKRERLEQEAEIWRRRATAEILVREAERAERELETARPATQAEIENFFAAGGIGEMPGIDSMKQAELQGRALKARQAAEAAKSELKVE